MQKLNTKKKMLAGFIISGIASVVVIIYFIIISISWLGGLNWNFNEIIYQLLIILGKHSWINIICAGILFIISYVNIYKISGQKNEGENSERKTIKLIQSNQYSKLRHPMYTEFMMIMISISLIFGNPLYTLLTFPLIALQAFNGIYEEISILLPTFGEEYKIYSEKVVHRYVGRPIDYIRIAAVILICLLIIIQII